MKKLTLMLIALTLSASCFAGYNANMRGKVTSVLTYTHGKQIYFHLENQPTSHPNCKANLFSIDASTPDSIRQQVFSRLLLAYAKGEQVNIGYDKEGGCSHGYIKVYRVG